MKPFYWLKLTSPLGWRQFQPMTFPHVDFHGKFTFRGNWPLHIPSVMRFCKSHLIRTTSQPKIYIFSFTCSIILIQIMNALPLCGFPNARSLWIYKCGSPIQKMLTSLVQRDHLNSYNFSLGYPDVGNIKTSLESIWISQHLSLLCILKR